MVLASVSAWLAAVPAGVVATFLIGLLIGRRHATRHTHDVWRFSVDLWRTRHQSDDTEDVKDEPR